MLDKGTQANHLKTNYFLSSFTSLARGVSRVLGCLGPHSLKSPDDCNTYKHTTSLDIRFETSRFVMSSSTSPPEPETTGHLRRALRRITTTFRRADGQRSAMASIVNRSISPGSPIRQVEHSSMENSISGPSEAHYPSLLTASGYPSDGLLTASCTTSDDLSSLDPSIPVQGALVNGEWSLDRASAHQSRTQRLRARYGVDIQTDESAAVDLPPVVYRVQRAPRMRTHRACHQCGVDFGFHKKCPACSHEICKRCPRSSGRRAQAMAEPSTLVMEENRNREVEAGPSETREQASLATAGVASQAVEAEGSQVKKQTQILDRDSRNAIESQPHSNMFDLQFPEVDGEEQLEKQPQNGTKPNLQGPEKEVTTQWDLSPDTEMPLEVDESGGSYEPPMQRPWKGKGVLMPWSDSSAVSPLDPLRDDSISRGMEEPCAEHSARRADRPHIASNQPDSAINSLEQAGLQRSHVSETFDPCSQPDLMRGTSSSLSSQLGPSVRSRSSIHYLSPLTGMTSEETYNHATNPTMTNDGRPMMFPAVQRVYRKPRQRIRYMCHECDIPLLQATTCSKCGHQRCGQCRRRPSIKIRRDPDPRYVEAMERRLASMNHSMAAPGVHA